MYYGRQGFWNTNDLFLASAVESNKNADTLGGQREQYFLNNLTKHRERFHSAEPLFVCHVAAPILLGDFRICLSINNHDTRVVQLSNSCAPFHYVVRSTTHPHHCIQEDLLGSSRQDILSPTADLSRYTISVQLAFFAIQCHFSSESSFWHPRLNVT